MSLGSIHRTAHKRRSGSDRLRSMAPTCLNARSRSIPSIMHSREQKIDLRQSGPDFARRHIGPNENEAAEMLGSLGFENLNALIDATVPKNIRLDRELNLPEAKSEDEALAELRAISKKNKTAKSFTGAGDSECITPPRNQRNTLDKPGEHCSSTPHQHGARPGRL